MAISQELSYAFLESHPVDAARVLERLAAAESGALLQSAPVRLAAPVLRHMLPLPGARCLEQLNDDVITGLLRGTGAQAGVALLRYFGAERRAKYWRSCRPHLPSPMNCCSVTRKIPWARGWIRARWRYPPT